MYLKIGEVQPVHGAVDRRVPACMVKHGLCVRTEGVAGVAAGVAQQVVFHHFPGPAMHRPVDHRPAVVQDGHVEPYNMWWDEW